MSNYSETTAFLQKLADQAMRSADNNASRLYSLPGPAFLSRPIFSVDLKKPVVGPPPVFSDLFTGSDTTDPTIRYLDEQADKWLAKFFPEINGCFRNQPEETLCGILSGVKPFGIDKTIFDLAWHQARDRAYRTVASEQRTVEASFSARGFTLPAGAMVDTLAQIEQRAGDAILDVNREQAIKDADIKQRMLEIGLQLSTQLKTTMLSAMADFYRMWISIPDKDIERARIRAQAMSAFYSALSSYHNVEIAFQELTLRAAQTKASVAVDSDRNEVARHGNTAAAASGLGAAINAFADVAASAAQAGGSLTAEIEAL